PVLLLHLEARIDGLVSPLVICIPYRSVESVIHRLEHRHYEGQVHVDPQAASQVAAAISGVDVDLRAEAGSVELPASEVLSVQVGDVIRLRRRAEKGVILYAGDVPTYVGMPGRNGNARAVQVRSAWERGR